MIKEKPIKCYAEVIAASNINNVLTYIVILTSFQTFSAINYVKTRRKGHRNAKKCPPIKHLVEGLV